MIRLTHIRKLQEELRRAKVETWKRGWLKKNLVKTIIREVLPP